MGIKSFSDTVARESQNSIIQGEKAKRGILYESSDIQEKINSVLNDAQQIMATGVIENGSLTEETKQKAMQGIEERASVLGNNAREANAIATKAVSKANLGVLDIMMNDEEITEIIVLRYDHILIEKRGVLQEFNGRFESEMELQNIINKLINPVGQSINIARPIVDATWEDGSRINATIPPASPKGATLTIRRFKDKAFTREDYKNFGTIDDRMLDFLEACVKAKISILISGGTGTGKTTFINMLSNFIPFNENVVTIEDTAELKLESPRVRSLVARSSRNSEMLDFDIALGIKNALRMRPDRIIVGEVRDGAMIDMVDAAATGHEGSMGTVHANSPENLVKSRYINLASRNKDVKVPTRILNNMFVDAFQLIIQLKRFPAGTPVIKKGSRKCVNITAVTGVDENGQIELHDIYAFDKNKNEFYSTGYYPEQIMDILESNGIEFEYDMFPDERAEHINSKNTENKNYVSHNKHSNYHDIEEFAPSKNPEFNDTVTKKINSLLNTSYEAFNDDELME